MPILRCTACNLLSGGKPSDSNNDGKLKMHKSRTMHVKIVFKEGAFAENYEMKISTGYTIAQLKGDLELLTGIPTLLQQLCFNDEAFLYDNTYLHELNLVNNCTLCLTVRHDWAKLVEAVLQQDMAKLMTLGITEDSDFSNPSIDYIKDPNRRREALRFRGTVALIISSHRGYARLVKQLIAAGINVNGQTQFKRTALHIVAAKGQSEILDILIHSGANIDIADYNNETALDIANRLEQTQSSRQLFLFRWQLRAKNAQPSFADIPMFPHQYFDSDLTIHFNGAQGQVYMLHVPPPGDCDRWKPRKTNEIVRMTSPTRAALAAEQSQSAAGDTVSKPVDFLSSVGTSPYISKKARPKSPAFAYENGIAPVGNKKEGKKTFEDWLKEKQSGSSRASSAFGSREGHRPNSVIHQRRLMSAFQRSSPSPNLSCAATSGKRQIHINTAQSTAPNISMTTSTSDLYGSGEKCENNIPMTHIPASMGPVNGLIYCYKRVKSAADSWPKHDRDKSGFTLLWE